MPSKPNFKRVTILLPVGEVERLKDLAHKRTTTMANVIRGAIDLELFITGEEARKGKFFVQEASGRRYWVSREMQSTKHTNPPAPLDTRRSRYERDPVI